MEASAKDIATSYLYQVAVHQKLTTFRTQKPCLAIQAGLSRNAGISGISGRPSLKCF